MILHILNNKESRDNETISLSDKENEIMTKALEQKDLKKRYNLYNQARVLRRIKEEIQKWELFTRGY